MLSLLKTITKLLYETVLFYLMRRYVVAIKDDTLIIIGDVIFLSHETMRDRHLR